MQPKPLTSDDVGGTAAATRRSVEQQHMSERRPLSQPLLSHGHAHSAAPHHSRSTLVDSTAQVEDLPHRQQPPASRVDDAGARRARSSSPGDGGDPENGRGHARGRGLQPPTTARLSRTQSGENRHIIQALQQQQQQQQPDGYSHNHRRSRSYATSTHCHYDHGGDHPRFLLPLSINSVRGMRQSTARLLL